jgi:aspartate ammonia-lyase
VAVIGSKQAFSMAAAAGLRQLNVFEPVIADCTVQTHTMLFINVAMTGQGRPA